MRTFKARSLFLLCLLTAVIGGVIVVVTHVLLDSLAEPPFHLIIEPVGVNSRVRFIQPGKGMVSKWFDIAASVEERRDIVLDSASVSVPLGKIEEADTTTLPGSFKVRVGGVVFTVLQRGIYAGDKYSEWLNEQSGN
jgi:hypothetical protein